MNIPENAVQVKIIVNKEDYEKKTPIYISIPVYSKPVINHRVPLNITAQATNSGDRSTVISVDQWKEAYDYADPAKIVGKERNEYITAVEKMVEDGVLDFVFLNENGEEISPGATQGSGGSMVDTGEEF